MFENGTQPRQVMSQCQKCLLDEGFQEAKSLSRNLLCHVLGCDMHRILMDDKPITEDQMEHLTALLARIRQGEPLQYVVGAADFMGYRFMVTPDVLIPRFDTETLVQWAEGAKNGAKVLDVCTGSGCIAVSLKLLRPDLRVYACDISEAALRVAKQNAARLEANVIFAQGDLMEPFLQERFDIILSNPPYIKAGEMLELPKNVREFEPTLALLGGEDGLAVYRRLVPSAAACLGYGGMLGMEIGYDQAADVSEMLERQGFSKIKVIEDMEHRPRVVTGVWEDRR